jgi:hypothetical protein
MHARPEIRDVIIAQKLRRWYLIAKYPGVSPSCSQSRARRNFHRLCAAHPLTAARLGFSPTSVYTL